MYIMSSLSVLQNLQLVKISNQYTWQNPENKDLFEELVGNLYRLGHTLQVGVKRMLVYYISMHPGGLYW